MKKQFTHFKDGVNVREKKVKRGYLNREEVNIFIMLATTHQLLLGYRSLDGKSDGIPAVEKLLNNQMITKEQAKNLRTAITYQRKFLESFIEDNLDRKTKETMAKRLVKWEMRVVDDYQVQKLDNLLKKKADVNLTMDEFLGLVDAKLYAECKGCTKNRQDCKLRDFFEANFIPGIEDLKIVEQGKCNCEYAY